MAKRWTAGWRAARRLGPPWTWFGWATALLAGVTVLTVLSPLLLVWLSSDHELNPFRESDWNLLSEAGQAYGAVSAILASLALVAVGASVLLQARQVEIAQLQATRDFHLRLFAVVFDNPDLRIAWTGRALEWSYEEWRMISYVNLVFNYFQTGWLAGTIPLPGIRRLAGEVFATQHGRRYWEEAHQDWLVEANSRRKRQFVEEVHAAYVEALREPALTRPPEAERPMQAADAPGPPVSRHEGQPDGGAARVGIAAPPSKAFVAGFATAAVLLLGRGRWARRRGPRG